MAKNPPPPPAPAKSDPALWLSYALVAVCGVCVGIIGTYFALRPQLQRPAPAAAADATPLDSGTVAGLPPAGLTAGQTPAQSDRTLGNFHYDQGNWSQAIRYYESALRQGSDDADIRTDLGNAYRFSGQPELALAQYQQAQRLNPQHEFSLFNQGGLYFTDLHNPTKALEVWNDYLARFPNGRNVASARQLIAEAGSPGRTAAVPLTGAPAPAAPAAAPPSTVPDATEQRLFKLVSPAKPTKP